MLFSLIQRILRYLFAPPDTDTSTLRLKPGQPLRFWKKHCTRTAKACRTTILTNCPTTDLMKVGDANAATLVPSRRKFQKKKIATTQIVQA